MNHDDHGISINRVTYDENAYLSLKATGKLTHDDYEKFNPELDSALADAKDAKIKAVIDTTELEGFEPRAMWDDLKLGLKHRNEFEKVAIYGNKNWQKTAAKIGSWFVTGEVQYFENKNDAIDWLNK
ncbi:STAS/SEC14 domain-containing protein [Zooshikella sp. RANM57]|uniref:STAS/SEC14 domain-containing protein n=1 Tax=Zooshikella sp. RANM57 TaxID=3425863 RepID=UPI003D6F2465